MTRGCRKGGVESKVTCTPFFPSSCWVSAQGIDLQEGCDAGADDQGGGFNGMQSRCIELLKKGKKKNGPKEGEEEGERRKRGGKPGRWMGRDGQNGGFECWYEGIGFSLFFFFFAFSYSLLSSVFHCLFLSYSLLSLVCIVLSLSLTSLLFSCLCLSLLFLFLGLLSIFS